MRISDWSSDVCSSDLQQGIDGLVHTGRALGMPGQRLGGRDPWHVGAEGLSDRFQLGDVADRRGGAVRIDIVDGRRSEEHTSELQSLMRISSAVFCLKKKTHKSQNHHNATVYNATICT